MRVVATIRLNSFIIIRVPSFMLRSQEIIVISLMVVVRGTSLRRIRQC